MPFNAARPRDLVVVLFVPLFFASNIVFGRFLAGQVGPWTLAFLRWFGAFALLAPFALPAMLANRTALLAQIPWIVTLGFLGQWVCGGMVYMALRSTTATNATLIYSASSVMILLLEWLFRGRPITGREWAGTALALAGVAVVSLGGAGSAGFQVNTGDLFVAVAALSWALYSVILKRPRLSSLATIPLFGAIALAGAVMLLPMALWETASGPSLPSTFELWLAVGGVALIPSVAAFTGYQHGIRRFGPGTMAMASYLWTPYGVGLAVLLLRETLRPYHLVGLALIIPGVVLATARRPGGREPSGSGGSAGARRGEDADLDPPLAVP